MTRLEEERLAFEFSDEWRVFKFDEHHDYRTESAIYAHCQGKGLISECS